MDNFTHDIGKTIGPIGGAYMMHPETGQHGESVGLGFLEFYALGRGGVLGDVDAKQVVDAFFFFNPTLVTNTWNTAKEKMAPRTASGHYADACAQWGRKRLGDIAGLDEFCKLAERVVESNVASGALFEGWKQMPLPDDAEGRTILLLNVLREMRGGAHIEAVKQVGLEPRVALATNSPQMYQLFGWTDEMPQAQPDEAARAEALTDELVAPAFATLDESERELFARVVEAVSAAAAS